MAQVLRVILFGPSTLEVSNDTGKKPGPAPAGKKWKLREITPGAIAFAAILVSRSLAAIRPIQYY
jgi:hypothetical protein